MPIDADQLASDIVAAIQGAGGQRWSDGASLAVQGAQTLAALAVSTTAAIASGQLDAQGVRFMENVVVRQTHEFALTLANLILAGIAAVFDAVINVLWGAMGRALQGTGFEGLLPAEPSL
ncbi:MAG TPA: hypothetical protein VGM96_08620 [Reyranella sp.]